MNVDEWKGKSKKLWMERDKEYIREKGIHADLTGDRQKQSQVTYFTNPK